MAKAKVEVSRAQVFYRGDGWRFRIKGANGEVIARDDEADGHGYSRRTDAVAAAEALCPPSTPMEIGSKDGTERKLAYAHDVEPEEG